MLKKKASSDENSLYAPGQHLPVEFGCRELGKEQTGSKSRINGSKDPVHESKHKLNGSRSKLG